MTPSCETLRYLLYLFGYADQATVGILHLGPVTIEEVDRVVRKWFNNPGHTNARYADAAIQEYLRTCPDVAADPGGRG